MVNDLIFDVGVNNGDDTAYYLERGYRVVGVEANPRFIEHANHRFEREIREGSLRLINAAIGSREGTTEFHVSDGNRGVWSSLDGANASQKGTPTRLIEVRCVRFGSLLEEFGTPYYLKIDIEGADHFCIEDIDLRDPPAYVSFEANHGRLCDLFTLVRKGVCKFQTHRSDGSLQEAQPAVTALGTTGERNIYGKMQKIFKTTARLGECSPRRTAAFPRASTGHGFPGFG